MGGGGLRPPKWRTSGGTGCGGWGGSGRPSGDPAEAQATKASDRRWTRRYDATASSQALICRTSPPGGRQWATRTHAGSREEGSRWARVMDDWGDVREDEREQGQEVVEDKDAGPVGG